MQQVFIEGSQISVNREYVTIDGPDAHHIVHVLRMKSGETLRVSVRDGESYLCRIAELSDAFVQADILSETASTELSSRILLFQAIPKGDRMETVIEKAVELGVSAIIPVRMKYCVVKLDEKKAESRRKRWQAIAESAARQSKRSLIPEVREIMDYEEAVLAMEGCDLALLPYENEEGMQGTAEALSEVKPGQTIGILIGPEGGFSGEEIERAGSRLRRISLGRRILRTDTAAIAAVTAVMLELEKAGAGIQLPRA